MASSTVDLTTYANDVVGSCNGNGATGDMEAVFRFTLTETRNVVINLGASNGLDAVLYVRQAPCASGGQLACVDAELANVAETITINALSAGDYFVFAEAYNTSTGTASLSVTAQLPPDAGPFELVSSSPPDGGAYDGGTITATFSLTVDTATVNATNAGLTWRGGAISITNTLSTDGKTITGTPSEFPINSTMNWNLTSGLTSNSTPFAGASLSMLTRDGAWRTEALRYTGGSPRIANGGIHRNFVTWRSGATVRAGHHINASWIDDAQLSTAFVSTQPEVAANSAGSAVVVWTQNSTIDRVFASRFASSVWQTGVRIDTGTQSAYDPKATMDGAGNILVVWAQAATSGGALQLNYARYTASTNTWGSPMTLGTGRSPVLAGNANGDAIVAYELPNSTNTTFTLMIATFTNSGGFSTPVAGSPAQPTYFTNVAVAAAPDGTVAALSSQNVGTTAATAEIRFARGPASSPFPTTSTVIDSGTVSSPAIAMGRYGQIYVAWTKRNTTSNIYEAQAALDLGGGAGFSAPARISLAANNTGQVVIAASDEHAVLVWLEGSSSLRSMHFNGRTGTRSLGVDGAATGTGPSLAIDARGRAALVFSTSGVSSNQFE